jgi:hypothetical protein
LAIRAIRADLHIVVADAIGKAIAQERKTFRAINDAAVNRIAVLETERAAPVLDLVAERDERRGRIQ